MNRIKTPLTNIMEIMDIVIKQMEAKGAEETEKSPMVTDLLEKGFKLEDIETALNLISMMNTQINPIVDVGSRDFNGDGTPCGVRHLHFIESVRFSADAQQFLLQMVEEDLISSLHFEKIVEYVWKNDLRRVSLTRLELIVMITRPENEIDNQEEAEAVETFPHSLMMH
ncbi:MAG: DUF494 family protein [Candidatus Rifleibacteriota bacterium]